MYRNNSDTNYVPLLRYHRLSFFYDALLYISGLGPKFKRAITHRANLDAHLAGIIVDVGCGTGVHAEMLADYFKSARVIGLDPDTATLAGLRTRRIKDNLDFVTGTATELPFQNEAVAALFSTLTFHHLTSEHKQQAFRDAYRVLAPGGHFILTDWGVSRVPGMKYFLIFEKRALLHDHFAGLIPTYARAAGFQELSAVLVKPTGIWQWHFIK